jgi:hypothetical protein
VERGEREWRRRRREESSLAAAKKQKNKRFLCLFFSSPHPEFLFLDAKALVTNKEMCSPFRPGKESEKEEG